MTYDEFRNEIDKIKADHLMSYSDFGFDFQVEWNDNKCWNINVSWPPLEDANVVDAYYFAEALQAFCFHLHTLVGTVIDDD